MCKKVILLLITFSLSSSLFGMTKKSRDGLFSARVSRVNSEAGLVRLKANFTNSKYLNKKDKVEIWTELNPSRRCKSYVAGKSPEYILVKIPDFKFCERFLPFNTGQYLLFYSEDLKNNITMGKELYGILLKKRLALEGKLRRRQQELDSHIEKVNASNQRFELLRAKLEAEWRSEIGALEEDKSNSLRSYKALQMRMDEIKFKMEQYRIDDDNLVMDRWALDPRLFYKK
ncbi:MAG: hypothetical protein KC493_16355 [Bacteriovoracaceae bacterium]|nr:hypothetical protein [Bacteriovoracaceae bacterium]